MGSGSKLMAWVSGESITAVKINSENTGKYTNYHCEHTGGKTAINAPYHFMHQTSGRIMHLRTKGDCILVGRR